MKASKILLLVLLATFSLASCEQKKLNVIISTDIGGSDPDDYQSLVHLLVYADRVNIKGLISSPPHQGRKEHIDEVINAYQKDYEKLLMHNDDFPTPEYLFNITKQGATEAQLTTEPESLSEGAQLIITKAKELPNEPLYVLVWGSLTDVAQAVHTSPDIKKNVRVYSIGSWNTVQDTSSRNYLYNAHPGLWWIENNTTFRGMYMGGFKEDDYSNVSFPEAHIKNHGALGDLFWQKKEDIKMGDTPSLFYLLNGDPNNPESESWGGAFVPTEHGTHFWTDNPVDSLYEKNRAGAKTVNKYRKEFLDDWAERMSWIGD
ncbi:DUF1593 domain-containing protein [Arcticibacterium luteifluviistationis]|uniref:Cellulose-binding Sde182 nucleoside hydrolase-like domain-containing protein n=1 Tax=Arcticibacterium luteifluviistationis TaxID=1784714 RepID=A0A2Z4GD21_9BACT|nr:DUF1593 domain-containing protein [Arcticibacterium luteifluviistationis]AWV98803.1 hypothetical protein DJ013_11720 [Arcticibacterium luteifluviistationis]